MARRIVHQLVDDIDGTLLEVGEGVDWVKGEIERRMGVDFEPVRPFEFTSNGDGFGWRETDRGRFNYGLYIASGRVADFGDRRIMDGLRAIARVPMAISA